MVKTVKKFIAGLAVLSVELIIIIALFLVSLFAFIYFTNYIFNLEDTDFDTEVFFNIRPLISDLNTQVMRFITFFATHSFLIPANIFLGLYLLIILKHKWYALKVPVVSLGGYFVMAALKIFFSRPRPDDPVYEAARGFSYPSGHAMSAMTFYGFLIYLVWKNIDNLLLRWILIILLSAFIVMIGFSRIYLRVHYASDVLAGFSMGLIWLVISVWVMRKIEKLSRKKIDPEINPTLQ
jgi:membrane-associated phospholipid phosphatase